MIHFSRFLLFVFTLIGLASCKKEQSVPENLLTKDQMVKLLMEVHILEARVKRLAVPPDSAKKIYNSFERRLFDELNVDRDVYESSYKYYLAQMDIMDEIYSVVVDSLNVRQQRVFPAEKGSLLDDPKKETLKKLKESTASGSKDSLKLQSTGQPPNYGKKHNLTVLPEKN